MADIDALVSYFCKGKLYRHVQAVVEEVAAKRGWEGKLLFWRCFGLGMEGNVNQAIRELEDLRGKRDFELAAIEALLHFHHSVGLRDDASIAELERNRGTAEDRASDVALLLAAAFALEINDLGKGKRLVDRILEKNPMNVKACTLKGWFEALSADESKSSRRDINKGSAVQYFEQALNADRSGKKELSALMGLAFYYTTQGKLPEALELLDQAIVSFQWFMPALVEKAKTLLLMQRWDLALETAERVLHQDPNDIGALQVVTIYRLTNGCDFAESADSLQQLCDLLDNFEPENPALWFEISKPFARLAERNNEILRKTVRLVERAKRKNPENPEYATEYAYQLALMGKYDSAFAAYEQASQLDESNGNALFGQIYCLVKRNEIDEASQQLEFLSVLQQTIGRTAQVAFLEAILVWQRDGDRRGSLKLLNETVHLHVKSFQSKRAISVFDQYVRFNPDFMMEIASEYLQHAGTEPIESSDSPPQFLVNGVKLLEKIIKFVPCMLSAQIALARSRYVSNNQMEAMKSIQEILEMDPNYADAHLLLAQIQLNMEDFQGARSSLEQALSHNFAVKDSITYMIVKSRVLLSTGELEEAKAIMEHALTVPGVKLHGAATSSEGSRSKESDGSGKFSIQDRAAVFVNLATVYVALKQIDKARGVIQQARREFRGTSEEVRIIVAESEIALKRNDIKGALRMLNEVPSDSPEFIKAHLVKANIFLNHRNDKDSFIRCYIELVESNPSAHFHLLLGEAYMRVSMSDEAIEAFKEALKRNPKDSELAKRIGKVLVSTHDYNRAIEYYKSALRTAESVSARQALRLDLSELYFNLGKLGKAEKELQSVLSDTEGASGNDEGKDGGEFSPNTSSQSLGDLMGEVKALKLLAKVHTGDNEREKVSQDLFQARKTQGRILTMVRSSGTEVVQQQKNEMANICILLASMFEHQENGEEQAVSMYNEALRHDPGNVASMLALAKLYMRSGDLERCHNQCVTIMRVDDQNEPASMMLADLMFQRNEFKVAIFHYQQLIERNPSNYPAFAKLVTLLFRAGELETVDRYFQLALHKTPRAAHDPGYCFCKGLFHRFSNEVTDAIAQFNKARRDIVWGEKALTQMIEIYVNPDNVNLWEDEGNVADGVPGANLEAVRTAQMLLEELPDKESLNYRLLDCYATMATKNRTDVEKAFQRLVEIVQENQDHVPSLLALSTALMMMKQTPKARNQLKRISKMQYDQDEADAFENCWLLLADIFIGSGKYDLAQGLCKKCLQYNRSCAKAWEYMGMIMEKEAAYADAAEHYEQAWKFQKMSSASVGYKLAFNYLKAKRYVEAIDVSNKVLQQFPQYPRIKKDILEKARASIRL